MDRHGTPRRDHGPAKRLRMALIAGAVLCPMALAQPDVPAEIDAPPEVPAMPLYLRGVDLSQPTPEAFRDWPSAALLERAYWLPWGWPTFQRASLFDRPVILMLTVPWNRYAQRSLGETFRDGELMRAINEGFITVFVSADRRPDLRTRYRSGTWPIVAFLLPNGQPMISEANPAGKPLPISMGFLPADAMLYFVREAHTYYQRRRDELHELGGRWVEADPEQGPAPGEMREGASDQVARWLMGNFDAVEGGFGAAPKFVVSGLAEYAAIRRSRMAAALTNPARVTLEKLVAGPLYDGRDGGVHRVAVAMNWSEIQYEKLLAPNGDLVRDLVYALRHERSIELERALRETAGFLTSVLGRPGGGFYLAQCADPTSDDGGGYWRAEPRPETTPPMHKLVLSGPNAMAGAALLRAGAYLGDAEIEAHGRRALDLVLERAWARGRGVDHVLEPGPEGHRFLVSQADVAFALADGFESTGERRYLDAARDVADFALNNLGLDEDAALTDRLGADGALGLLVQPLRPMEENARLARALIRLADHGLGEKYRERAITIVKQFTGDLVSSGVHGIECALAVEELIREPVIVRVQGPPGDPGVAALRRAALRLSWSRVLVTYEDAKKPAATVSWREQKRRVGDPDDLAAAVRKLTGAITESS